MGHPDPAVPEEALDSREASGPERMRSFDWVIGTLRRAGLSVELGVRAFSVPDGYIHGFGRQQPNRFADFEFGLDLILDGLERALGAARRP